MTGDSTGRQIDYLCQQVANLEERMEQQVNPVDFGELKGEVKSLVQRVNTLSTDVEQMGRDVRTLVDTMNEARGGWRAAALLAGLASTVGGALVWAVQHVTLK